MIKSFLIAALVGTVSATAHASYIRCEGKTLTVTFAQSPEGLVLWAKRNNSEMGSRFKGLVETENIVFKNSGKSMKDVKAVCAADFFKDLQACLNVEMGAFFAEDRNSKIVLQDDTLKCQYSAGE